MAESEEEVDVLVQRVVKDITNAFKRNPNMKELLQCGVLNPERDLYLGQLALTKFPKSPETWIHRRWVLKQFLGQVSAVSCSRKQKQGEVEQVDGELIQQLSDHLARMLHQEMKVCSDAACRYPSNYNAWSHRIWVLQHMAKGNAKVIHNELSSMKLWVSMHVSDHSGFHYRQFLLKELITELSQTAACLSICLPQHWPSTSPHQDEEAEETEETQRSSSTILQLFHQEIELCSDLIQSFPGHETLWSHRRQVFYLWHHLKKDHQHHCSNGGSQSVRISKSDPPEGSRQDMTRHEHGCVPEPMEVDRASLPDQRDNKRLKRGVLLPASPNLPSEHSFVDRILDRCSNIEQRRFALAYRKWLDTIIGHHL
ncbi:protein prenyltransferase alpha subunit repeat-containing protein 1 isoform X4 [Echeneis naucrates]|uniref:protein prenyltransferase alpha subunit repeat-containing protein 1 isoform X4 n=1 Tax=Echeneis naucrates TaxID=173247 RepID=UPI0011146470|nr:protein prenyltransferase alpha subunit repeat-containing protein 1 isoform X4 [Echeneis naucrates]